jgi:hypothetical protein
MRGVREHAWGRSFITGNGRQSRASAPGEPNKGLIRPSLLALHCQERPTSHSFHSEEFLRPVFSPLWSASAE